jgi:hypothetical protein
VWWQAPLGFVVTAAIGWWVVPRVVKCVRDSFTPLPAPSDSEDVAKAWRELVDEERKTAGPWVGRVELPIFFAALWVQGGWPLLASWLAFKLALYWQGANFTAFPTDAPNADHLRYLHAKRQLGTQHIAVTLVGTGANIIAAIVGVAFGGLFLP